MFLQYFATLGKVEAELCLNVYLNSFEIVVKMAADWIELVRLQVGELIWVSQIANIKFIDILAPFSKTLLQVFRYI